MKDMENFSTVATGYATGADVCRTFKQDMKSLYLLSLLLTAGRHLAEQCFVSSLGDCLDMRPVFKEWTDSWTRRIVLQNAIRILKPAMNNADKASQSHLSSLPSGLNPALQAVLRLSDFERFVLVMTVLEGYSDRECSLILRSSRGEIVASRAKALKGLTRILENEDVLRVDSCRDQGFAVAKTNRPTKPFDVHSSNTSRRRAGRESPDRQKRGI